MERSLESRHWFFWGRGPRLRLVVWGIGDASGGLGFLYAYCLCNQWIDDMGRISPILNRLMSEVRLGIGRIRRDGMYQVGIRLQSSRVL
ncbi:hypothetical protein K445DRAFT_125104 [Daldinia sp. EC12]|nr:hypothetical protein K445DRAFT_125104 [Daldinia sp. EC12]